MGSNMLDMGELDEYAEAILKLAQQNLPKESKKFVKKEAQKLKKVTVQKAKQKTNEKTGNYYKGIRAGKAYKYRGDGGISARVFSGKPAYHAHFLEYGHRQVQNPPKKKGHGVKPGKGIGKEVGFVPGLHVFEEAANEFEPKFIKDIQEFIDKMVVEL